MEFNNTTRALTNSSGYVKRISDEIVYKNNVIFLGVNDLPENYVESAKEEYEEYLEKCEEEMKKHI